MATRRFPRPIATVDIVVFALVQDQLSVLVTNRKQAPFAGDPALPGGFVHQQEDASTDEAASRVLEAKAGAGVSHLEQLGVFSGADRDPRGWSLSVAYLALVRAEDVSLAPGARWCPVDDIPALAFDHGRIVQEALVRLRNKASYSSLPALLLPTSFTMPQLQRVYECALGMDLNTGAFRRKVEDLGLIEPVDEQRPAPGAGRPAQVYRLASQTLQDLGRVVMTPDRRRGGLSP